MATKPKPAITDEFDAFAKLDALRVGPKCPVCKAPADIRALVEAKVAAGAKKSTLEVRRTDDDAYWTKRWAERALAFYTPIVVPDVRFPNECEAIAQHGGVLWRVIRPGTERGEHDSETLMDGWRWFEHVIVNDGTLADLHAKVDSIMEGK